MIVVTCTNSTSCDFFLFSFCSPRHPDRNQSDFGIKKASASQRKAASDDELSRKDDIMRRNSASAPPLPPFSDSAIHR